MQKTVTVVVVLAVLLAAGLGLAVAWQGPAAEQARAMIGEAQAERVRAETSAYIMREAQAAAVGDETLAARVAFWRTLYASASIAVAVLLVGVALAIVAGVALRASLIYPNAAGQMPMIRVAGPGYTGTLDPNRAPGPVAIWRVPTRLDALVDLASRALGRGRRLPALEASTPLALSEAGHVQLGAQASAVAMVAGATRYRGQASRGDAQRAAEAVVARAASQAVTVVPAVTVLDSRQAGELDRLLAEHAESLGVPAGDVIDV